MLTTIFVSLFLAVILGLTLLRFILKTGKTPKLIVLFHGIAAFFAIIMMINYVAAGHTDTLLVTSMVLFILAALGGITMMFLDFKNQFIPRIFLIAHPAIAISGVVALVVYILS